MCAQFLLPYIYLSHSYTQPDASFPEILVIMHFAVMLPQGTEFLCRTSHAVAELLHMVTSPRSISRASGYCSTHTVFHTVNVLLMVSYTEHITVLIAETQ